MKKGVLKFFSKAEIALWTSSVLLIVSAFMIFDRESYISLFASLLGTTSLIFCAKGNPIGQVLIIFFSFVYAYISFTFSYYGEMITYLCMTSPMATVALISWLKNPFNGNRAEVRVNRVKRTEIMTLIFLTGIVTVVMYFVLKYFNTSNLYVSTFSVSTSFFAVCLTAKRSPYYALAYALNDLVLIALWILACFEDVSYVSVAVCFIMFLANDVYGFFNWRKMQRNQSSLEFESNEVGK